MSTKLEVTDLYVAEKMIKIATSATDRGIEYNLSFNECKRLLTRKTCFFTGVEMSGIANDPKQRTFDRLDNSKGYVDGNLVACCKSINGIKGASSIQEIAFIFNGLKKKD